MRNRPRLLHRVAVATALLAVAALGVAGCSMVGPESSWDGNEGSISGTVRSDGGSALAGIDVSLRAQDAGGQWIEYNVTTDATGSYRVNSMELGQAHAYEMNYTVYVNRTDSSALPIVSSYGTHVATVPVQASGTSYDVVIIAEGPDTPEGFVE
jgi:hypothetical protein